MKEEIVEDEAEVTKNSIAKVKGQLQIDWMIREKLIRLVPINRRCPAERKKNCRQSWKREENAFQT